MLRLRVIDYHRGESQQVNIYPDLLDQNEYFIGSNQCCDLILNELEIDRIYARIRESQGAYYFRYFGNSDDEVYINNSYAYNKNHALQTGDLIRIDQYVLMVEAYEPPTIEQPNRFISSVSNLIDNISLRCARIMQETPTIKTFSFVTDPPTQFDYKPGQQISLSADIEGVVIARPYFISSSPTRPHAVDITMQYRQEEIAGGRLSNWLYEHLQVGDRVTTYSLPNQEFTYLPNSNDKVLLISQGMGVVPLMSMVRWVYDTATPADVILVYCAPTLNDILFRHELLELSYRMANFRLVVTIAENDPGQAWMGHQGPVTGLLLQSAAEDLLSRTIYACGDGQFLQEIQQILQAQQFPLNQYHEATTQDQGMGSQVLER